MKVAVIMPLAEQRGGGELMLWHLMQQGRDLGVCWLVVFLEDGPMVAQVRSLGIEARVIPAGRLRQPHRFLSTVRRIAALARREHVRVIFSWMTQTHLYGGIAARMVGIPALWYQLGTSRPGNVVDQLATLIPSHVVLTCSQAAARSQARLWPPRRVQAVHPGVDLERFDGSVLPAPADARRRLGLPAAGPLIGMVGRLQRWKGMHVLIEAMPQILSSWPEAHCVIVGGCHDLEPGYPAHLEERISALGLERRVTLAGLQRNVPEWMQAMDVVVHASDHEPFGIVVIEAMALGKPVVAGAAAGPAEIISDGTDGLLAPYGDSGALAGAVGRYLNDPAYTACVGQAARRRACHFSTERYAQAVVAAMRQYLPARAWE